MNTVESLESRMLNVIGQSLGIDHALKREESFIADLGCDSLDTIELVMAVEDEFGIDVPDDDAEKITTVGDAIDYINRRAGV